MKHQDVIERANKRVKELVDALDVFPANYSTYHNKVESVLLDLNYWWGQELDRQREEQYKNVTRVEVIDHYTMDDLQKQIAVREKEERRMQERRRERNNMNGTDWDKIEGTLCVFTNR